MPVTPRFPDAPAQYDQRDQNELRRMLELALGNDPAGGRVAGTNGKQNYLLKWQKKGAATFADSSLQDDGSMVTATSNMTVTGVSAGDIQLTLGKATANTPGRVQSYDYSGALRWAYGSGNNSNNEFIVFDLVANSSRFSINTSGNVTLAGDITISGGDVNLGGSQVFSQFSTPYHILYGGTNTNPSRVYLGSNTDAAIYMDALNSVWMRDLSSNVRFQFDLAATPKFLMNGTQILTTRRTGWGAPTGTPTRTTFATGTVTLVQLAERVKALIDDLTTHGVIGA